jgi:predicted phosphodiesterase
MPSAGGFRLSTMGGGGGKYSGGRPAMTEQVPIEPVSARKIAVLADCHIHPGGGPEFPPAVLAALRGADLIVTLGDMGDAAGLDQLAAIAPVTGTHGVDDSDDPRTAPQFRALSLGPAGVLGCVFDATAAGLATGSEPFAPAPGWTAAAEGIFGPDARILLHAATHRQEIARVDGWTVVNPGSAVLPAEGAQRSFALLTVRDGAVTAEIVTA